MNDAEIVARLEEIKAADAQCKVTLMTEALDNERFYMAVRLAVDTAITFGVSNVKKVAEPVQEDPLEYLIDLADSVKGNATKLQKDRLNAIASQSEETFDLVRRIVRKTLGCGIGEKRLHEIAGGVIPYYPYMRCSGLEKLDHVLRDGEAFSQLKDNGMYLDILVDIEKWTITYRTRNGNELKIKLPCEDEILTTLPCSGTLMGEATLLFPNDHPMAPGLTMPRAAGNAIISQAIEDDMKDDIIDRLQIRLWDFVVAEDYAQLKSAVPYEERINMVDEFVCESTPGIQRVFDLIETVVVRSEAEVWEHFRKLRMRPVAEGCEELEGLVVKHPKGTWKDGTSGDQAKVKDVKECDLIVTDWTPGEAGSKYDGLIGSLRLESSCGGIVVNSSGLSDADRKIDPDSLMGTIAATKFTRVCTRKDSDIASLENPRIVELRKDKTVADSREYIENLKSIKLEAL